MTLNNQDLPTTPPNAGNPTTAVVSPAIQRQLRALCKEFMALDHTWVPEDCLEVMLAICRLALHSESVSTFETHDAGHKWVFRHFTIGQSATVNPKDITNVRQSIHRLQRAHNMKFTTAKQPNGFYLIRRVA